MIGHAIEPCLSAYVSGDRAQRLSIGRLIRQRRRALGMRTQAELAHASGVNVETISRIENGANVEIETLAKIQAALTAPVTPSLAFGHLEDPAARVRRSIRDARRALDEVEQHLEYVRSA